MANHLGQAVWPATTEDLLHRLPVLGGDESFFTFLLRRIKMRTKTLLTTLATAGLFAGAGNAATILLGGFDGGTSNNDSTSGDATDDAVIQDASAVGNVNVTISGIVRQRPMQNLSSLWGTTALTPAANNINDVAVNNSENATLTFVVTNTGTLDVTLEEFHFRTRRDNETNSDDTATFTYVSGDLGSSATTDIAINTVAAGTTLGSEVDLGSLLTDSTLSAGESATFSWAVSGSAWVRVDNVGFSGEIVPEPGSLALLGLGGLLIGARRRR